MLDAEIPTTPATVGLPNFGGYLALGYPVGFYIPTYPRTITHPTNGQPQIVASASQEAKLLRTATPGSALRQAWLAYLTSLGN